MATSTPTFDHLWQDEVIRFTIFSNLDTSSICSLRLTNSSCSSLTTAPLFARTRLPFTPSSLTRQSRLEALSRIGHHIEHFTFSMPHTPFTFLPPLLNPLNGREVTFLYTPHTSPASVYKRPKYGCPELGDLLTQQYPPVFHAATNVPSFISALKCMPNLRHLTVSCPGQDAAQRYRRDAVDYALISLRIAIERAPLPRLEKLSLSKMHPAGLLYFRQTSGYGCTPSAGRRWKQIRKLSITMNSWDFVGAQPGLDHLKILDDYIRSFSPHLEKVSFGWNGRKGSCPFTLFNDPLFAPPKKAAKLFAEVTSPMSPLPAAPSRPPMVFPSLRYMQVRNASMTAEQVADLVDEHRDTVREFDFENVQLLNEGTWENALAPLTRPSGSEEWLSQQSGSEIRSTFSSSFSHPALEPDEEIEEVIDTAGDVKRSSILITKLKKKRHRKRRRKYRDKAEKMQISEPVSISDPMAGFLQPTIFDPNVQGVQRNFTQEAVQRELAEDPEKRVSALKKAKEAVLRQLGKEFCSRSHEKREHVKGLFHFQNRCSPGRQGRLLLAQESTSALVPLMFNRC